MHGKYSEYVRQLHNPRTHWLGARADAFDAAAATLDVVAAAIADARATLATNYWARAAGFETASYEIA